MDLVASWREQAELLEKLQSPLASAFRHCAEQLAVALEADDNEFIRLDQAARESGYDKDSLGRLIRRGQLLNRGTRYHPLVRRGDLPRKLPSSKRPDLTVSRGARTIPRRKSS